MALPSFAELTPERYRADIDAAMEHQRTVLASLREDDSAASLDNVLWRWEEARRPLTDILSAFYSVKSSDTNDELDAIAEEYAPKLAAHDDAILLDRGLYDRFSSLKARIDAGEIEANEQDRYHLSELLKDFEHAGVALDDAQRERLMAINARLAELSTTFEKLNRESRNEAGIFVEDPAAVGLDGADVEQIDEGHRLALVNTTQQPLSAKITSPELRRDLLEASLTRGLGAHDTRETLLEIAHLRAERATLLGFASHAELVTSEGTAGTPAAVEAVLIPLAKAALAKAETEGEQLAAKYAELAPGETFTAADWMFVETLLRKERFEFDESELDEYLTVDKVVQACYDAASELYGITFTLREDLRGHVEDAQVYEIADEDGSPVGLVLVDLWARPSKNGGAWMTQIAEQSTVSEELPIVTVNCNYRKAVPTTSWDEVITMFHEFGHALHGLFGTAKYPSRSGTAVPRDFVEFPSQVNEIWAWQPGRVLPAEWVDKLEAASKFGQGYATAETLIAAVLDFMWHSTPADELPKSVDEIEAFEAALLERHGLKSELVPPRYRTQYFAHIWGGGYAASYYGYSWAERLDADAVAWFEENGMATRANGDHFRTTLLGAGGSVDPMETYRRFRGRDPQLQPLLDRLGLSLEHA